MSRPLARCVRFAAGFRPFRRGASFAFFLSRSFRPRGASARNPRLGGFQGFGKGAGIIAETRFLLTGVFRLVGTGGKPRATETAFATKRERISPVRARRDFSASKTGRGNAMHTETPRALAGLRTPRLFFFPRIDAEIFARVEADFGACFHASIFFPASIFGLFFRGGSVSIACVQKTACGFLCLVRIRSLSGAAGAATLPPLFFCGGNTRENRSRQRRRAERAGYKSHLQRIFIIVSRLAIMLNNAAAICAFSFLLLCLVRIRKRTGIPARNSKEHARIV